MKKVIRGEFAVFILSHKRSDNIKTIKALKNCGYTGDVYIIVDDLDPTIGEYKSKFGDKVVVFDKKKSAESFDVGDNFKNYISTSYVRNVMHDIAKDLGIRYFIQLDDDYTTFGYKFNKECEYKARRTKNLDEIFNLMCMIVDIPVVKSFAMAQGGDYIGGKNSRFGKKITFFRKVMNSFVCRVDKPFKFLGRMNEDVNMYLVNGRKGEIFFTTNFISLSQVATQKGKGGMSDIYLDRGTYVKSFYSIMYCPSCVDIAMMGTERRRIHHRISWKNAVPCIMSEKYLKVKGS
jgi:hypothetical protein